jgi:hypothetical protein
MIHEVLIIVYRLIVLFVLGCTVRYALDKETDGHGQLTAVLLVIPLLLRVLMIK